LVTETDQAVEEMIKTSIAKRYPSHKLFVEPLIRSTDAADDSIGEESVAAGEKEELTDEFTWIVDPIDVRIRPSHIGCRD
jgi:myo-inositol-1(or 4)-monophosphatase